jgi:hypothetical protein
LLRRYLIIALEGPNPNITRAASFNSGSEEPTAGETPVFSWPTDQ